MSVAGIERGEIGDRPLLNVRFAPNAGHALIARSLPRLVRHFASSASACPRTLVDHPLGASPRGRDFVIVTVPIGRRLD
jgi:hypothetical protein